MFKKASLCFFALLMTSVVIWQAVEIADSWESDGKKVTLTLKRGPLTLLQFSPKQNPPRAIIIFGSGDGGWGGLEEAISHSLRDHGYEVIGFDCLAYAKTDYDLPTLQADFARIAGEFERPYDPPAPLIFGGWSMGAAQAIAAAGGPQPAPGLTGLLLVDPCSRGRYGVRLSDRIDILPTGTGTFSMLEFARTMNQLRVVQWHAMEDSIDSRSWLESLTAPHREFDFPKTGHYYNNNSDVFLQELVKSVSWILQPRDGLSDVELTERSKAQP